MKGLGLANVDALEEEDCGGHVLTQICFPWDSSQGGQAIEWFVCVCVLVDLPSAEIQV